MEYEELELQYSKIKEEFELFKNIVKPNSDISLKIDLSKIEKIINERVPTALEQNAPPNFPELYFDFKYEYGKFREFILYEHLIGKNIVALGGGFSSGKSSFINSLMGKSILPAEIDPSTSVPAYIVNGKDTTVYGVNVFDTKIDMNIKDIKTIAHGFGEIEDEHSKVYSDEVTLGHILKSMFLSTPLQEYKHIALLDTPGYSKADTSSYSAKTDEKIARAQLNSSNYILWFIQSDAGTITEEDIKFINSLKKEIPKLIIISKADKPGKEDIKQIIEKVRGVLDIKGIQYVDVFAYSRNKPNEFDSAKIKYYLQMCDNAVFESTFAYNFKVLFVKCKEYYENIIDNESKRLNRLNTALTLSDNTTVTECLSSLINEIKRNIHELKDISAKLKALQDEFFTEIKIISDVVGIKMPEPSEIDLLKDKIKDPLELINENKERYGKKYDIKTVRKITSLIGSLGRS
ncbi:dynamin family protein [Clostridium sp.]|uniref:dynamin family protein n=1 Tax=Clostridium sp. TaxID=1506 RepID=UPI003D6D8D11